MKDKSIKYYAINIAEHDLTGDIEKVKVIRETTKKLWVVYGKIERNLLKTSTTLCFYADFQDAKQALIVKARKLLEKNKKKQRELKQYLKKVNDICSGGGE